MPAKKKTIAPETAPETWNYEGAVEKIEDILHLMESGDMNLSDLFEQFGVAAAYLKECDRFLATQRAQVELTIEYLTDDPDF
jgi:exodeoxyribonuclease VII small subunit